MDEIQTISQHPLWIPFYPEMEIASLKDIKICTTRPKKYGKVGDHFKIRDEEFIIERIERHNLAYVSMYYFRQEGFKYPEEFKAMWIRIHPGGFQPEKLYWTHFYRKISEKSKLEKAFD